MQAILTTSKQIKRGNTNVTARTASGKIAQRHCYENTFAEHLKAAQALSRRMGWGENLIAGETKEGFAFIPVNSLTPKPALTVLEAAAIVGDVACTDPREKAWAIETLMKVGQA